MFDLSIVIPSIRTYNWQELMDSIHNSCTKYSYEIIFVGPQYDTVIDSLGHVKFIRDFGSPNRCQQLGYMISSGRYIHFGSDDCMYIPKSIDTVMDKMNGDPKVITCNYSEGGQDQVSMRFLDAYGTNKYKEVEKDWVYFNVPFMNRFLFRRFGFDCKYETTCWGHADLAARMQKWNFSGEFNFEIECYNESVFECSHMPSTSGDHGPIHFAFFDDQKLFYDSKIGLSATPFEKSENIWSRRFR